MRRRGAVLALAVLAALGGCSGVQAPLAVAGAQADSLAALFTLMLWVCGIAYLLVLGFVGWSLLRTRRADGEAPRVDPASPGLDRSLGLWAVLIVAGLTVLVTGSFFVDRSLARARADDAVEVRVTGHQWWWRIQYRDPASNRWIETANELHLPVGRTARVSLEAADVIHSFWVPNVAGKMDVIPGRTNLIDMTPHRTGWFRGQCAEFCGTQHAHMAFDVKVESPAAFSAWLAAQAAPAVADPAAARGAAVVTRGACAACHVVRGTPAAGRAGPDLTHLAGRRTIAAGTLAMARGNLQGWIANPQALKPGTSMPVVPLAPADLDAAARYLETLK